jgi:hypothetical protein
MWETLQSRLPVEFELDGIKTIEAANEYLHDVVIPYYKDRWSVEAAGGSIYVPIREDVDVDTILCAKEMRTTDNAGVFSIKRRTFQIVDDGFPLIPKGQKIEVLMGLRIGIKVRYQDRVFDAIRCIKPEGKAQPKDPPREKLLAVKPHLVHGSADWKQIWHAEDYNLSLQFLYDLFLSDADIFKDNNLAGKDG